MLKEQNNFDVAIIGGGPVGLFAGFQAGMLGLKTCITESLDILGGQCSVLYPEKPIYDIPAHPSINGIDLINNLVNQIKPFNHSIFLNTKINTLKKTEFGYQISSNNGITINTKTIVLACGNGVFDPNRIPIEGIDKHEGKQLLYSVQNIQMFKNKTIAIAGGGDSATDWAIECAKVATKIYFIHRREKLRCSIENERRLYELRDEKKIEIKIPFQIHNINKEDILKYLTIENIIDKATQTLEIDYLLAFFGIKSNLDFMQDWNLELNNNLIQINQETMETSMSGIFAIGDICSYKGKLKLILTGFAEGATAMHNAYKIAKPEQPLHFEHSTTKGLPR